MTSLNHVSYNGKRISYRVYGSGSHSLMLFHGLVGSAYLSKTDIQRIEARDLSLIMVERPGYGGSDCFEMNRVSDFVPMAEAVLDELGTGRLDLAGTSAGGPYAWAAAAAWGERVENLFILAGVPTVYQPEILDLYSGENLAFYKALPNMSLGELQDFFTGIMTGDEMMERGHGDVNPWLEDSIKNRCHGMASQSRIQIRDWGADFGRIRAKVRLYHSPEDEMVPFAAAQKMAELVPGSRLVVDSDVQAQEGSGVHMASIDRAISWMLARYRKPYSEYN